jgi:DNA-binding NarL/FixJ family response regulator
MTPRTIRVVLADDHPVYRLGLRALLEANGDFDVVGEVSTGREAIRAARELDPDVVVMDLGMPDINGIEATRSVVGDRPGAAVLMLTYSDEDQTLLDAVLAGARGFVLKDAGPDAILRSIRDVAAGEMVVGASVAGRLQHLLGQRTGPVHHPFPQLTPREREILELMATGADNRQIAARLGVGEKRVRNCVSDIYTKLGVSDRTQAVIAAREAGLGSRP